jgi:hypothetical protein
MPKPPELDAGFEEIPLDEGFEPITPPSKKGVGDLLLDNAKGAGQAIKNGAEALGQDVADTARGVEQGATLGAGSIINGGAEAATDKLRDLLTGQEGKSFLENYRKHQQESAKNFKDADERSPWLYGLGEVGGTLGSAYLTGGLSAEANALRGAAGAGKMALAKQLGKSAIKGAGVGAIAGANSSEGTLTDDQGNFNDQGANQMAADAIGGGIAGGVAAPAMELGGKFVGKPLINAGGKLLDYGSQLVEDSAPLRQARKAYEMGKNGLAISNSNSSRELQGAQQRAAVDTVRKHLENSQNIIGDEIGNAVNQATASGGKINIAPEAQSASEQIANLLSTGRIRDKDGATNVMSMLDNLSKPQTEFNSSTLMNAPVANDNATFSPKELKKYLPTLQDLIKSTDDNELKKVLINLKNGSEAKLQDAVPNLEPLKTQYHQFMKGGPEELVQGNLGTYWLNDASDPEGKLAQGVKRVLETSETTGRKSPESLTRINDVIQNMQKIEEEHPGFMQKIGFDPDAFKNQMQDASDQFAMSRSVLGEDPHSKSLWSLLLGANSGRGQIINKANLLGRAVGNISESPVADISRKLYNLPSKSLTGVAQKLKSMPALSGLGQALENGINQNNESLKNAALFSIMQNPKARLLISGDDLKDQSDGLPLSGTPEP